MTREFWTSSVLVDHLLDRLPAPVRERIRVLRGGPPRADGRFVLYWLHHALRGHENPALDAAIGASDALNLPLLVYQGLSERYRFASDRHHTFILQGVRDLQRELAARGIACVCHVERPGHRGPHLRTLARRAALLVTDDMPVPPTWAWLQRLIETTECPVWCVDTACIVPMQIVGKLHGRAFEFRDATRALFRVRVGRAWEDLPSVFATYQPESLPFEPVDLRSADLPALVAECEIDHTVGPVPHTVGGTIAGYRRWERFRRSGLAAYARRRNDPLIDGVSRMSAYLHYGMVSPLRIAREAAASNAEKFLDELLIWRELAHNLCFHRQDFEHLSVLPKWARDTLGDRAADERPAVLSWERLARGRTGDALWDAAQASLRIHGELHNNVRMTWGKALLRWTADPQTALTTMIDLNHRYALDGRDPCSYGGILWCLGLFDRPFPPPRPIYGTIRDRSTDEHAARIDVEAYRRRTSRPLSDRLPAVAVIGAGISGLTCARTLADHGLPVTVFEKSRGLGGRMASRRGDDGRSFDHGAQYFTVRDERFRQLVDSWRQQGIVQPWTGRIVSLGEQRIEEKTSTGRFVACPGMNAICKHLGEDLSIRTNTRVGPPQRNGDGWLVADETGKDLGQYDVVIVSAPAPQSALLLRESPELAERASSVAMQGCWAVMAQFPARLAVDFDGAFVHGSPLSWIARNSSKPNRGAGAECWILHAAADWSQQHLEEPPESVVEPLLQAFWRAMGLRPSEPLAATAHRWRHALPQTPLADRCLFDAERRIGACGDWCSGPRVEGALLSGSAAAGRVLGLLPELAPTPSATAPRSQLHFL